MDRSNKAKIARRVVEVLDFFDDQHSSATVMDIVRRYDRPQSSTSELLSSLVEAGLLFKDPGSRSYSPTPRVAMLGCAAQPAAVRDGRLVGMVERLTQVTGLGVAVFGMVGTKVQIFNWRPGSASRRGSTWRALASGRKELLCHSAAGWLLLSTTTPARSDSMLRRLNAEAPDGRKFSHSDLADRLQQCRAERSVSGNLGFATDALTSAVLIPGMPDDRPMAIGLVHHPSKRLSAATLIATLHDAATQCVAPKQSETMMPPPIGMSSIARHSVIHSAQPAGGYLMARDVG